MLISAENLSFGFAGNPLLENITFTLSEGDRVGLIGANGEGKTTLLRLILSELEPEGGSLFKKNGIRIGYLANAAQQNARPALLHLDGQRKDIQRALPEQLLMVPFLCYHTILQHNDLITKFA